jgi:hypothetical protein
LALNEAGSIIINVSAVTGMNIDGTVTLTDLININISACGCRKNAKKIADPIIKLDLMHAPEKPAIVSFSFQFIPAFIPAIFHELSLVRNELIGSALRTVQAIFSGKFKIIAQGL